MKRIPSIVATLLVLGFFGFEINHLRRSQHLFEPLFTYDRYESIGYAARECGDADVEQRERFDLNLEGVRRRARVHLAEAKPEKPPQVIQEMLAERARAKLSEVDGMIEQQGCDGPEMRKLRKLYELRARLNVR